MTSSPEPRKRDSSGDQGLAHGIRSRRKGVAGFFHHFLNYVDEDYMRRNDPEAYEKDRIRVISAGPNAFLYCLDEKEPCDFDTLEQRFPGLAEKLSLSPGVGLVLARSNSGPVCFCQGKRYRFPESGAGPFADRADAALVIQGITDLLMMPQRGRFRDLRHRRLRRPCIVHPRAWLTCRAVGRGNEYVIVRLPEIVFGEAITHPSQLYDHFIRYQAGLANDAGDISVHSPAHASHRHAPRKKQDQKVCNRP